MLDEISCDGRDAAGTGTLTISSRTYWIGTPATVHRRWRRGRRQTGDEFQIILFTHAARIQREF